MLMIICTHIHVHKKNVYIITIQIQQNNIPIQAIWPIISSGNLIMRVLPNRITFQLFLHQLRGGSHQLHVTKLIDNIPS